MHVLGFDPRHGADQARNYAGKYASTARRNSLCTTSRMGLVSNARERPHNQAVHTFSTQRKPEKWYYLETTSNGLKNFLKCRTVGLCMTHNRLLGYHVVRSTKPVHFIFPIFIAARDRCMPREEAHLAKYPDYPDGRRTRACSPPHVTTPRERMGRLYVCPVSTLPSTRIHNSTCHILHATFSGMHIYTIYALSNTTAISPS